MLQARFDAVLFQKDKQKALDQSPNNSDLLRSFSAKAQDGQSNNLEREQRSESRAVALRKKLFFCH